MLLPYMDLTVVRKLKLKVLGCKPALPGAAVGAAFRKFPVRLSERHGV